MPDKVKEVKVFKFPNATARVTIPELPEEEYNRRFKRLHDAAKALLMDVEKKNKEKEAQKAER